MAVYEVKYREANGSIKRTSIDAQDESEPQGYVASHNWELISIKMVKATDKDRPSKRINRICLHELTSLLSMLLSSSLSVRDALSIVKQVAEREDVRILARRILDRIDRGASFHEAIIMEAKDIPPVYKGLVRIGERTGELSEVYKRLTSFLDEQKKIRDTFSGAMIYPIIILVAVVGGMIGLSIFALPKLLALFSELGGSARDSIAHSLRNAKIISYTTGAVFAIAIAAYYLLAHERKKNKSFALKIDKLVIRLPIVGDIFIMRSMLDFAFAMESLTQGGIPLDEALTEASEAVSNSFISDGVLQVRESVRKGSALSSACSASGAFKPYVCQWIAVGERTGKVAEVFSQLRAYYQSLSEKRTKAFIQLIEPVMTILLGIGVLILIFLFVIPIFSSMGSLF